MKKKKKDNSWVWSCNYVKDCNKSSYYHVCTDVTKGKHIYICPKHLKVYLGYD